MKVIHWLGAGLSSIPGIRRLASKNINLIVWNRTLSKAQKSIDHVNSSNICAKEFNLKVLENTLTEGDILISQLPANMHFDLAKLCIEKKCHFVATSYISKEIRELDNQAKKLDLVVLNEVGLDPGIDHFFSHLLLQKLKEQKLKNISVSYKSYCGGIPAVANKFTYKFSWSPIGVIKALNNKSQFIEKFNKKIVVPYKHIKNFSINQEYFEAYPNRDSLPYIHEYNFLKEWQIEEFVRGTLRLNGWSEAWKEIFNMLDDKPSDLEARIKMKSEDLWNKHKYKYDEEDRVVLWVNLEAKQKNKKVWSETYHLDEKGIGENTAMAKLVSITLSAAIDLLIKEKIKPGVQGAPSTPDNIKYFFKILSDHSIKINHQKDV